MLYKTILITYALGLAGLGEAAPTIARSLAARDGGCLTDSECSAESYCLRVSADSPYECMTPVELADAQPDPATEPADKAKRDGDRGQGGGRRKHRGKHGKHRHHPQQPKNECMTDKDCTEEGTHCLRANPEAGYMCLTEEQLVESMPKPETNPAGGDDAQSGGGDDAQSGGGDDAQTGGDDDASTGGGDDASTGGGDDASTGGGDDASTGGGDDASTGGGDDASTGGGDDAQSAGGDDAQSGGGDDAQTGGGDDASTGGGDDASTGGGDDASTGGGDDASTGGGDDASTGGGDDSQSGGGDDAQSGGGDDAQSGGGDDAQSGGGDDAQSGGGDDAQSGGGDDASTGGGDDASTGGGDDASTGGGDDASAGGGDDSQSGGDGDQSQQPQNECRTDRDCKKKKGTYCLRASPEMGYMCMTPEELADAQPEPAKKPAEKRNDECRSTEEDCPDGSHCVSVGGPNSPLQCYTTDELYENMPIESKKRDADIQCIRDSEGNCLDAEQIHAYACLAGSCPYSHLQTTGQE